LEQLRAHGELCDIRSEDLRLTTEGAIRFFNQSIKLSFTLADIATLKDNSEDLIIGNDDDKSMVSVSEFEEQ